MNEEVVVAIAESGEVKKEELRESDGDGYSQEGFPQETSPKVDMNATGKYTTDKDHSDGEVSNYEDDYDED